MLLAPAKLNLSLTVGDRRKDGYHTLDSLVHFIDLCDQISLSPSRNFHIEYTGAFAPTLSQQGATQNIVERALEALHQHDATIGPYHVVLHKNIPVGAGLGGGSADAAAILRYCGRHLPDDRVYGIALSLGADVPVCLGSRAVRMRGIGEQLDVLPPTPAMPLLVLFPWIALSTAAVFGAFRNTLLSSPAVSMHRPESWHNDLQPAAIALCPETGTMIETLTPLAGCRYAGMSGSGSAVFALFETNAHRDQAMAEIIGRGWFVHCGQTLVEPEKTILPQKLL